MSNFLGAVWQSVGRNTSWILEPNRVKGHTHADALNHISLKSNIIECINIFLIMNDVLGKCGISNGNL